MKLYVWFFAGSLLWNSNFLRLS